VDAARAALNAINPEVAVVEVAARVAGDLVDQLISEVDIVLDCSDNFATRHALNAAASASQALVSGAAMRFDGQVAVFDLSKQFSLLCCLFPEDAEVEEVQCSVMGVFAPLTGGGRRAAGDGGDQAAGADRRIA